MNGRWTVARSRQTRRTFLVIGLLRANAGCTLDKLAGECGVTTRTIRRDLEALEAAGLPVYTEASDVDNRKRWRFVKGAPCPICNRGIATGKEYREQRHEAGGGRS